MVGHNAAPPLICEERSGCGRRVAVSPQSARLLTPPAADHGMLVACGAARAVGARNKRAGGPLSVRQGLAEPPRAVVADGPAKSRFGEQLIAVLPRLRRFARGLTGAAAEADDLVQAACERALARQHQFQEGTRFDSWMFRIVQTIWIDQIRGREVRKEDSDLPEDRFGSDEPVRRIEARLALDEVRRAITRLPADQRTALMLVTVDGLSYKEAAEVVGVPVGTIMSRLARARVALQAQIAAGHGVRSGGDAEAH
jgi:RNA polymerase sigma-70 factor (ECF subfamily)